MEKYNEYKDSGIEWLGEIPEHWEIRRIKDLTSTQSGTTPSSNNKLYYEDGIHNWIRTTDLNNGELFDVEYKITELAVKECRMKFLPIDSVLVAMYGGFGTIGKNAILKKESTINQSVCSILPNSKNFDSIYLLYFLKCFRNDWRLFADGTRKDPNINQEAVKTLFLYNPPLSEQTQIANYLDDKTTAIDKKINLLNQKIKHYKAYRKTLINETVTKGLDKSVKLKDSGIDWIGEIPEHWILKRGKEIISEFPKSKISAKEGSKKGKYKFFTSSDIQSKWLDYYEMNEEALMLSTGGKAGVNYCDRKYSYSTDCWCLKIKKFHTKYYYYLFESMIYEIGVIGFKGAGIEHLQKDFIKQGLIPVFSNKEQQLIADYLDAKTSTIDKIIKNIETQINTLKELRKTLINEVVTGKVKVAT